MFHFQSTGLDYVRRCACRACEFDAGLGDLGVVNDFDDVIACVDSVPADMFMMI